MVSKVPISCQNPLKSGIDDAPLRHSARKGWLQDHPLTVGLGAGTGARRLDGWSARPSRARHFAPATFDGSTRLSCFCGRSRCGMRPPSEELLSAPSSTGHAGCVNGCGSPSLNSQLMLLILHFGQTGGGAKRAGNTLFRGRESTVNNEQMVLIAFISDASTTSLVPRRGLNFGSLTLRPPRLAATAGVFSIAANAARTSRGLRSVCRSLEFASADRLVARS